ncbi:MAG: hypothetical protein ACXWIN_09680, partial [Burkholderiaceae bacterium]
MEFPFRINCEVQVRSIQQRLFFCALRTMLVVLSIPTFAASWTITDLGTLGGTFSEAHGINNLGQIVGFSGTKGDSTQHAFRYKSGVVTDLSNSSVAVNSAIGINQAGQIVGYTAAFGGDRPLPFLYQDGVMTTLNVLSGRAWSINNAGAIAGEALI